MGAIAGYFMRRAGAVAPDLLERQAALLAHRGPAGSVIHRAGPIGFVHCRDRVLPLVHAAGQVCVDAGGRFVLICNGRIFNHRELARELAPGSARPPSILEVMLQAFMAWGEQAFRRFNGAFACAIWDRQEHALVLARDHCGIKQLFVSITPEQVVFATEIKAVLAERRIVQQPDRIGIANYLALNRRLFRTERTLYDGVTRVLPAQVLRIDGAQVRRTTYWQLAATQAEIGASDEQAIEVVRELIIDAVRIRLPDSPRVGADLSGGFDSSSIVCLTDHLYRSERGGPAVLDTFSFEFGTDDADEVPLIKLVAGKVGARHHHLQPLDGTFLDDLGRAIRAHDGPLLESSILLLWDKKKRAHEAGVEVLLSGLGGDEVFMGTLHYLSDLAGGGHWLGLWRALRSVYPVDLSTGKQTCLNDLFKAYILSPFLPDWLRRLRGTLEGRPYPPPWIAPALVAEAGLHDRPISVDNPYHTAYDRNAYDLFHYELLGGAIPFHDDCSGAFAVDTRFPFLDIRLVEAMFAMNRRWKLDGPHIRRMQKRAMQPFLPAEILADHLKKNFHGALHAFIRRAYEPLFREFLAGRDQLAREYLDWPVVERCGADFFSGAAADPGPLWLALNLEKWLRDFAR